MMVPTILSDLGVLAVVFAGALAVEAARARYGLRLGGVVAVPMVAVLSLTNAWVLSIYLPGVVVLFVATTLMHRLTLLYGRALLSMTLTMSMGYALVVIALGLVLGTELPVTDFQLYFTALFAGAGAYTLYLTSPADRPATVTLSGALFVIILVGCRTLVTPPARGLYADLTPLHILPVAGVLTAAGLTLTRLERRERPLETHRRELGQ